MVAAPGGRSFELAPDLARSPVYGFAGSSHQDPFVDAPVGTARAAAPLNSGYQAYRSDSLDWGDFIPLQRAEVRLRSRWSYALSRLAGGPTGRRHAAAVAMVASALLTAACASAVRSVPEAPRAPALAANDPVAQRGTPRTLPEWQRMRASRTPQTSDAGTKTATLGRAPFRGAPDLLETPRALQQARVEDDRALWQTPSVTEPRSAGLARPVTELVAFASAPFPYDGQGPGGTPFLDVNQDGQRGHRNRRGQILWESTTFNDRRVLVHMPAGFDPNRPAVMVVFFHGYGATLSRDVLARQQVPAQITASGANAVLLAPQFAVDARDPSIGRFWEPGGFRRFLAEASHQLAQIQGDPASQQRFAKMPIVLVAYSGGYVPASWALKDLGDAHRVRGLLMLDAAYGELERFADFSAANRSSFLVSAYTRYTQGQNAALQRMLAMRGIGHATTLNGSLSRGGAVFLASGEDASHNDFVTQAWTGDPIKDILTRLPEFQLHEPQTVAAAADRTLVSSAQ